jgi:indole-3-glycerol phosphate synthase
MAGAFTDALLNGSLPIITEVKRQDADGGALMGERTIPQVVADYLAVGAPCISVVTGRWFGGDDQMLRDVAELTDLPLLKKDFITREKQIVAAKEMGASAILLTARILPTKPFQKLIETALRHGLTPFVEIADHDELETVVHAPDCIVAVNNKDIRTQEREPGDIESSRSLLEAIVQSGTPCPVSASAITDPKVAAELVQAGFKGLLIGTGLLLADSVRGWVDEFERHRREPAAGPTPSTATPGSR